MNYEMKLKIRNKIPRKLLNLVTLFPKIVEMVKFNIDDNKRLIYSIILECERKRSYELLLNSHILEKGMSHENLRYGYGKNCLKGLSIELRNWIDNGYSTDNKAFIIAISALHEYYLLHKDIEEDLNFLHSTLGSELFGLIKNYEGNRKAGFKNPDQTDLYTSFAQFSISRVSLREYDERKSVSLDNIKKMIAIAKTAPSSCNRQAIRSYALLEKSKIIKILDLHKGMTTIPPSLIILTSDISAYPNARSRSLPYVDTGMFAQNLLLAATEMEIATVALNACMTAKMEQEMRGLLDIPKQEKITCLIAFGCMKSKVKTCKSCRIPLEDTLTIIGEY